jgi:hypothetical protein
MAKKLHGGTHHVQGVRHGPPKPRIYGLHGGTHHIQGKVHDGTPTRQYGLHGGTNLKMGVLKGRK